MSEEQQAVVDTAETQATPAVEANDARNDDLDTALSEFDQATSGTDSRPEPKTGTDTITPDANKRLELMERRLAEQDFKQQIEPVVKKIRGDIDPEILSDDEIVDWMDGRAKRDPRLQNAWVNRAANPKAFEKVIDNLGRELSKKFTRLPDRQATEDREAVTAAVRGASTKAPEGKPDNFSGMSDAEYRKSVQEKYGFSPL